MPIVLVFSLATLLSAGLMFSVEPLLAKLLLPVLGGAPAVWNAALVFFQTTLLIGYSAAHALARFGPPLHACIHAGILVLACFALPIELQSSLLANADPALRVLALLASAAGIPFFALSMNAPALGRELASIDHPAANDPYFLYAASNAGSICALIAYPFLIERFIPLSKQIKAFSYGYALLAALVCGCALVVLRSKRSIHAELVSEPSLLSRKLRWLVLAALPSAQLIGVTQYLTTDVAAAPLLWLVPLLIYLLTFVLVFATRFRPKHEVMVRYLPLAAALVALTLIAEANEPAIAVAFVHLAAFFLAAMVCHGELARDRPPPRNITEFYLTMSAGGVLGGLVVALLAPVILDRNAEYPLTLILMLLCRKPPVAATRRTLLADLAFAALVSALMLVCVLSTRFLGATGRFEMALLAVPVFVVFRFAARPVFFALGLCGVLLVSALHQPYGQVLYRARNFFGALRVSRDNANQLVQVVHGSTVHGRQLVNPALRRTATAYYHASGPAGDLFEKTRARVGIVGLGAGSLAAYARSSEEWTFFEINPEVIAIAREPRFFSFLSDAFPSGQHLRMEAGDARLRLAANPERFDLLVIDAFSSDAIPVHLLTVEAMALYASRVAPGGAIAFHISNKFLDIEPVMAGLASSQRWSAFIRRDLAVSAEQAALGKTPSVWAVMARTQQELGETLTRSPWRRLEARAGFATWTDDRSSIVPLLFHARLSR